MSAAVLLRRCKYKKNYAKRQICERLFLKIATPLFQVDNAEVVLVVDDDAVGLQLAGFAGGLPKQIFLQAGTLRTDEGQDNGGVRTIGHDLKGTLHLVLVHKHLDILIGVHLALVELEEHLARKRGVVNLLLIVLFQGLSVDVVDGAARSKGQQTACEGQ